MLSIRAGGGGQLVHFQGWPSDWIWWRVFLRHAGGVSAGCESDLCGCVKQSKLWVTGFCPVIFAYIFHTDVTSLQVNRQKLWHNAAILPPRCWRTQWKWSITPWSCEPLRGWRKTSASLATSEERTRVSWWFSFMRPGLLWCPLSS